jgi:hypothetical protein
MFLSSSKLRLAALLTSLFIFGALTSSAQEQGKDACHVYVVNVAKTNRAYKSLSPSNNDAADEKALSVGQTIFPEFRPTIGEEELTTKHYSFPGSKLIITASVFYTDESMASHGHGEFVSHSESMLIGITVSPRAKHDAIGRSSGNHAVAEVTYDQYTNKIRAQNFVTVGGRQYLVGIECDCMANKRPK